MIILTDNSFKVTYSRPSAKLIIGWSDEEMINFEGTKNINPDDVDYAIYTLKELINNPGKSVDGR